jgi:hypothetical protein
MISIGINIEHVFNQVNMRTLYIADQIDPSLAELMADKIPLTEDDRSYFKIALRDACVKLALLLSPLTKGVSTPFQIDEENGFVYYNIDENRSGHNTSLLETVLPGLIMRALMLWIVCEWLRLKGINAMYYAAESSEYETVRLEIRNLTKQKKAKLNSNWY